MDIKTGDKVLLRKSIEVASGLHTEESYFVIGDDSDSTFRLAETRYESNPLTEKEVY